MSSSPQAFDRYPHTPALRWRRALILVGLAVAVALLATVGPLPRHGGLPHLVAVPPLGFFADLRLLVAAADSYPVFVVGVAVSLAVRTSVLAWLLGSLRRHARLAGTVYAVALVPALLAATVQFSGQALLYARLFWPAPMLTGVTLAVLGPAAWRHHDRLRTAVAKTARQGLRVDVLLPYVLLLLALGAATDAWGAAPADPVSTAVVLATVFMSAAATVLAIERLSAPPPQRPLTALAVVAVALGVLAVAVDQSRKEAPVAAPREQDGSVLLMSGINSSSGRGALFETDPAVYGYPCERTYHYSYAGVGAGAPQRDSACPITTGAPYQGADTQRPLAELTETFARQVQRLPPPVTVLAHSQAPWIAWQALAEHPRLPVDRLVLLGPFPDNPLGYPPPGTPGSGRIGGDGVRVIATVGQTFGFGFDPDSPLARQVLATPGTSRRIFSASLPERIEVLEIPAIVDLPLRLRGTGLDGATTACPVRSAHPSLPLAGEAHVALHRFQTGAPLPECPRWRVLAGHVSRSLAIPPLHEPTGSEDIVRAGSAVSAPCRILGRHRHEGPTMNRQATHLPSDPEAAGALRQRLRNEGWRSDVAWAVIGSGSAATISGEAHRTVIYLGSLRDVDGGAGKLWKPGDVPAPAVADAREVFRTRPGDTEWHSHRLEAPPLTICADDRSEQVTAGAAPQHS